MQTINPLEDHDARYIKVKAGNRPERVIVLDYSAGMLEISVWDQGMNEEMANLKVPMKPKESDEVHEL